MSWFYNLAKTYDKISDRIGIPDQNGKVLLPPRHMGSNTDVCVTIDGQGNFRRAEEEKVNIIIPCTEDSAARTSQPFAHPLHDQISYLALEESRRIMYLSQLEKWKSLNPKLEAVYRYIAGNTLIADLTACGIKASNPKLFVRFSVEIPEDLTPELWKDLSIASAWQKYCEWNDTNPKGLCYVTGEVAPIRMKHPKGVNPVANGAKLISCNDETNFTYKGRFTKAEQANAISEKATHKAHATLKYLIETQGYKCDTQAIVAWVVDDGSNVPNPFASTDELLDGQELYGDIPDTDIGYDYATNLRSTLYGQGDKERLKKETRRTAVISVNAATTGRMAVTFYKDMGENEYIDRILAWHESCCWWLPCAKNNYSDRISAPSSDSIIAAVYGEPVGSGYKKIKMQARERLLHCILNSEKINRSWLSAAMNRVSNPFSYTKREGGWDRFKWERAVKVTCAIARKYYKDKGEEFNLELETTRNDRDYLYGRLLAYADYIEIISQLKQGKDNAIDNTNALRYMTSFAAKPFQTWQVIYRQLNPYMQKLKNKSFYQNQIDEIMSLFQEGDYENNKPLDGRYLMGYSLQRRELNKGKKKENEENAEQEN